MSRPRSGALDNLYLDVGVTGAGEADIDVPGRRAAPPVR